MMHERSLQKTATSMIEAVGTPSSDNKQQALIPLIEKRMVNATWVLRRLPDKERGFLRMKGALWPETASDASSYPRDSMSVFEARRRVRISAQEIDHMQPSLDLLLLLPDLTDRHIVFWTAWHQDGEVQTRVPWIKVRRSMGVGLSRWTLKRRYEAALQWLSALIALQ